MIRKPFAEKRIWVYFVPLVLLFLLLIIKSASYSYSDFASYYFGSKLLLQGNYQEVYENYRFNQYIYESGFQNLFVSFTPFPPFSSILFAPFTLMPPGISKLVFNILSATVFIFSLLRTIKYFSLPSWFPVIIPFVFYSALKNNILFGQTYLLLFCLLLEGFIAFEKKQYILCSLLWGLSIVFKIFPALIFLFLLIGKHYKQVIFTVISCFFWFVLSIMINGFESWKYYVTELFPRLNNGELNDSFTFMFQSAQMLLKELFVYDKLLNPTILIQSPYLFLILLAIFKTFIVSSCIQLSLKKTPQQIMSFGFWVFASLLISPNGSTYSLILLMIILIGIMQSDISSTHKITVVLLLFFIVNIPVYYLREFATLLKFPRLYLMFLLFICCSLWAGLKFKFKIAGICLILFMALESFKLPALTEAGNSDYLLDKEEHLLIYEYRIQSQKLCYTYWSEHGAKEVQTDINVSSINQDDIAIKNNQIYYGGNQLTYTHDKKRKPGIINNDYLIYLSDKNRGVGMYTLRKIKLK
ncbi:MAG: glycosyltransferase family 87 protein [Bacteroidota bacterium]|nr:glycosyltransferase family 87 protein [Bacteroidota bacterium]